jgi:hypothetical protein
MSVEFTQSQVRNVVRIPPETMRHWRKVLPPLARRARRASFSHGDIVALAVVRELVRNAGISSSALAACADSIFSICNGRPWHSLAQCRLQIERKTAELVPIRSAPVLKKNPVVMLPLGPLIEELGQDLLGGERKQSELMFPPTILRKQRR